MKIYIASSWRNQFQQKVVLLLRKDGHKVYDFHNPEKNNYGFHWSEIDKNWQSWNQRDFIRNLNHSIAEAGFKLDFDAMKWAECCLLILPAGRSAHTEAGWMKGKGKKVFVFMPISQEPELMYKIYDRIIISYIELRRMLNDTTTN